MEEMDQHLFWSARCGYIRDVHRFLDAGANPNAVANKDLYSDVHKGYTPLLASLRVKSTDCLAALIERGADVNLFTEVKGKKASPLIKAAQSGRYFHLKVLADAGADLSAVNEKGENLLMNAARNFTDRHWPIVHYVMHKGTDINEQDADGHTALMKALSTKNSNKDLMRYLIMNGSDFLIKNNNGKTAYDIARKYGNNLAMVMMESIVDHTAMSRVIDVDGIDEPSVLVF